MAKYNGDAETVLKKLNEFWSQHDLMLFIDTLMTAEDKKNLIVQTQIKASDNSSSELSNFDDEKTLSKSALDLVTDENQPIAA